MGNEHMCTYSRAGLSLFTRKPFKHGYSWTWNINTKSKYSQSNNVSSFSSLQCVTRRKSACIIHHILRHTPLHPIPSFFTAMVNIHIQQFAQCKYKYSQEAVLFWFFILVLYNGNEQIFVPWSPRAHRSDGEPKSPTHLLFKLLFTKSRRRRGEREGEVYLVSDRIKWGPALRLSRS